MAFRRGLIVRPRMSGRRSRRGSRNVILFCDSPRLSPSGSSLWYRPNRSGLPGFRSQPLVCYIISFQALFVKRFSKKSRTNFYGNLPDWQKKLRIEAPPGSRKQRRSGISNGEAASGIIWSRREFLSVFNGALYPNNPVSRAKACAKRNATLSSAKPSPRKNFGLR